MFVSDWKIQLPKLQASFLFLFALVFSFFFIGFSWSGDPFFPTHPDRAFWMDGAYRIARGQIPHKDFFAVIGPAWLYVNAIPAFLYGPNYANLPLGVFWITLVLACMYILLLYPVLSKNDWRIFFLSLLGLFYLLATMFQSQFLDYNEIANLLVSLVLFASLLPRDKNRLYIAVIAGSLLAILFFWKVNFFVIGLVFYAISFLRRNKWPWHLIALASSFFVCLVLTASIDWAISDFLYQYNTPAKIKGVAVLRNVLSPVFQILVLKKLWVPTLLALILFVLLFFGANAENRFVWKLGVVFFLFLIVLQGAICISNASHWKAHAAFWVLLIAIIGFSEDRPIDLVHSGVILLLSLVLTLTLSVPLLNWMAQGDGPDLSFSMRLHLLLHGTPSKFAIDNVGVFKEEPPVTYKEQVISGAAFLKHLHLSNRKIATLAFANPFPVIFRAPPPHGLLLWFSIYDSFYMAAPPSPNHVLADVEVLAVPLYSIDEFRKIQVQSIVHWAKAYMEKEFRLMCSNSLWEIWIRKGMEMQGRISYGCN